MTTERNEYIMHKPWGTHHGKEIRLFRLTNDSGAYVELINYGATLVAVVVPDRHGERENVVLGYPSLKGYVNDTCYIGSTVGRYANRIGGAKFELDNVVYHLEKNDGNNTLHGGLNGFHGKVFAYRVLEDKVVFTLLSEDGESGYPGNLELNVEYAWNNRSELSIQYVVSSDKKTVANVTNHAYFNLSAGCDNIFDHRLTIRASGILETTRDHIPTGSVIPAGRRTFIDNKIRERLSNSDGAISGLNTYYLFERENAGLETALCRLSDDGSGRVLEIFTTYPGVQLYTGDYLSSTEPNNRSRFHKPFDGLCLECQYCPDSPNHAHFPSTVLEPGKCYHEKIVYRFGVNE